MASQEQGWNKATSKNNNKKNKERETHELMKQQYADYLHSKNDGFDDINDFDDDEEFVPETPEELRNEPPVADSVAGETSANVDSGVKELAAYTAWLRRGREFDMDPRYHKNDLALLKFDILTKDRLLLDEHDITPVIKGWGTCLLGRCTGRFPGKEAINDLTKRWPCKSRVTFHRKGWLCFQFGCDEDREAVRQKGPFDIFGIPLVLQPMPENFDPNMEPEVNIPLWVRLVDLPMQLWNFLAVSKIASCIGTPLSTDFATLRRETLDGPRVQIIVNTTRPPKTKIDIELPSGIIEQKIEYEFFPKFCNGCKMYGHFVDDCREQHEGYIQNGFNRAKSREGRRSRSRPRLHHGVGAHVQGRGKEGQQPRDPARNGNQASRPGQFERTRSRSRPRPKQLWMPTGTLYQAPILMTETKEKNAGGPPKTDSNTRGTDETPKPPMQEEVQHNAGEKEGDIPEIPRSPNRFETLAEEGTEPKQIPERALEAHIELVKDIIAAIPPILAGQQGSEPSQEPNPYVNSDRRHRSKSRDPRNQRGGEKNDVAAVETTSVNHSIEEGDNRAEETVVTVNERRCSPPRTGGKKKHKKHTKGGPHKGGNYGPVASTTDAVVHASDTASDQRQDEQDTEAVGRLSRAERGGDSTKSKKQKSKSRSKGKKNDEDKNIPSDWEDGVQDDPGSSQ